MIKVCKIRIYPNQTQIYKIYDTLGCCRFVKNLYIEYNINEYHANKKFLSGYDFSKKLNKLKKEELNFIWIKEYSSKAIKDSIMSIQKSFKRFFKKHGDFPRFHSRKKINKESFFFIKDNIHYIDKNHIKLPILGTVRITESKYLPDKSSITSGRVIREYDKFYVSFIYETECTHTLKTDKKIAVDVGIKRYATMYTNDNEVIYINHFKDYKKYKSLDDKIKKLQKILSHKVEINYNRKLMRYMDNNNGEEPSDYYKNIMKGESYNSSRIRGLKRKIRKLHEKKNHIRKDFIYKLVNNLTARIKPKVITIEDLNISEMIRHTGNAEKPLHKYISESGFYLFRTHIISKCFEYGIKLRMADKYFASSKTCSICGYKNKLLTLIDREYVCPKCGLIIDRDVNAAINLLKLKDKKCFIYA